MTPDELTGVTTRAQVQLPQALPYRRLSRADMQAVAPARRRRLRFPGVAGPASCGRQLRRTGRE